MSDHGDSASVDRIVRFQIIKRPTQTICPCRDTAPPLVGRDRVRFRSKRSMDTVLEAVVKVRVNVTVVDCYQRITAVDDRRDRPTTGGCSASCVDGSISIG